jgi:hypothetical protein
VRDELRAIVGGVFGEYAARQGKRRWVDKTPNYFRVLPLIDWLFRSTVLYLFVVRHPLDTIDSLERAPYFAADVLEDPDIFSALQRHGRSRSGWARYWLEVNERMASFGATCPSRCHTFRYEDLVFAPQAVLTDLLRFIGEELPSDLVENALTEPHTSGYEDWKIRGTTSIHQTSLDKWKEWPISEVTALWKIVGPLAESLGYVRPDCTFPGIRQTE